MVSLGNIKKKLPAELPAPSAAPLPGEEMMEGEEMESPVEEAPPMDLAAISDDILLAEVQKRGLNLPV
jgi:hypothetical protein